VITRRGFLKILGGTAAAVAVAPLITPVSAGPLFIPSQNLDMGVPRAILTATEMPLGEWLTPVMQESWTDGVAIPMLLVHDEFSPPGWQQFGREKVPAGTTLLVDLPTAERWVEYGVGTPGPGSPLELQEASARLGMTRRVPYPEDYDWAPGVDQLWPTTWTRARRDDAFDSMIRRATEKAKNSDASAWWNSIFGSGDA
jgi:hypothetical protein